MVNLVCIVWELEAVIQLKINKNYLENKLADSSGLVVDLRSSITDERITGFCFKFLTYLQKDLDDFDRKYSIRLINC